MAERTMTRRTLVRRASGLVLAGAAGLVAARPQSALAAHYCGCQFGPIHRWIYGNAVDARFMHDVVWRESGFDPGATNPYSGAAGLAQFMAGTWAAGEDRFGIYGSPYDWVTNLTMMNAYLLAGEPWHWSCNGAPGCSDV